jgi:hypothetical protein
VLSTGELVGADATEAVDGLGVESVAVTVPVVGLGVVLSEMVG